MKPLLTVYNVHFPEMGRPPALSNEGDGRYLGYFAGGSGDQWLFAYDRQSGLGELRGGDAGWDEVFQVERGRVVGSLLLSPEEQQWLAACWLAATGRCS